MGEPRVVVLRLSGELSIKARATRKQFVDRLLHNLRAALASAGVAARVERHHVRIFVRCADAAEARRARDALQHVFGVQSLSLAACGAGDDLASVVTQGAQHFRDAVAQKTFAVRARTVGRTRNTPRTGKRARSDAARATTPRTDDARDATTRAGALTSRAIENALGARLLPVARGVNLSRPEVTAHVEIFERRAYFFHEQTPAPGGLPLGSGGHAVALVSGGFDSAVAAWCIERRGVRLDFVFCNLGGALHRHGALRVLHEFAQRWGHGAPARLHVIPFADLVLELQRAAKPRLWQVLLKRRMLRAAELVAGMVHARAIVTGEALGQVSSQTLANLQAIGSATTLPILQPLIGMNKEDIIAQAHRIGTGALSALVDEYCALTRSQPATAAKAAELDAAEARLDFARLEKAVAERERVDLRACDPDATGRPELETTRVPAGAVVIDLRPKRAFDAWHHPSAVHLDFATALKACASFEPRQSYVAVCEYGLMSAHLAEHMHAAGLTAFHFRGGTRALKASTQT